MLRIKAHAMVSNNPFTFVTVAGLLGFALVYILISAIFFGGRLH